MCADSSQARWAGLLLAMALLSTGCVALTPPPGLGMNLGYTPREAAAPASAVGGALPRGTAGGWYGRATAGHHVLPREFREWFEKRGFTGEWNQVLMQTLRNDLGAPFRGVH